MSRAKYPGCLSDGPPPSRKQKQRQWKFRPHEHDRHHSTQSADPLPRPSGRVAGRCPGGRGWGRGRRGWSRRRRPPRWGGLPGRSAARLYGTAPSRSGERPACQRDGNAPPPTHTHTHTHTHTLPRNPARNPLGGIRLDPPTTSPRRGGGPTLKRSLASTLTDLVGAQSLIEMVRRVGTANGSPTPIPARCGPPVPT